MTFRYGNHMTDRSIGQVILNAFIGGKPCRLRLYVVPGKVPLLISRTMLKAFGAKIDTVRDEVFFEKLGTTVPLQVAPPGNNYQLDLVWKEADARVVHPEVETLLVQDDDGEVPMPEAEGFS